MRHHNVIFDKYPKLGENCKCAFILLLFLFCIPLIIIPAFLIKYRQIRINKILDWDQGDTSTLDYIFINQKTLIVDVWKKHRKLTKSKCPRREGRALT